MTEPMKESARRVQEALRRRGVDCRVQELADSTRSAAEAAAAVGCRVEQIVKSIVFRGRTTGKAVLVVAGGANRIDEKRLCGLVGEKVKMADPDFVRRRTGFAIGGVPPAGHATALEILVDEDLMKMTSLWAAAGTPHALFALTPAQLQQITGGRVARIR